MQEHFHFTTDQANIKKTICNHFLLCFWTTFANSNVSSTSQSSFGETRRRRYHWHSYFRKAVCFFFRTCMASLCHWKLVLQWAISRTFSVQPAVADHCVLQSNGIRHETRSIPCLCGRRQHANRIMSRCKNVSRQTISRDRRYRVLCFEKTMVMWILVPSSSQRLRTAHGVYMVTESSCHDRTATETVMIQISHPYI